MEKVCCVATSSGLEHGVPDLTAEAHVDVDVMMSGLVPFLPCPLLQGPEKNPQNYEQNPAGAGYLTAHSVRGGPDPGEIDLWYL